MATNTGPLDLSQYISGVTGRAYDSWKNQQDQMDWAKRQFDKNQGTSDTIVNRALDTGQQFGDWSKADRGLYEGTYVPAMKQQMDFARGYTTPERMAANRAGAMGMSNIAFDSNADAARRQLQSYDINPASGRFAGLDAGLAAARAKQAAAAGTQSDRQTEMLGQQYLSNAIATGQVLPGQVVNEAGAGLAAGNQAVNTGLATTASGAATMGTPMQWNALGNDMYKEWARAAGLETQAGLQGQALDLQRQKLGMEGSSGIGAAIGAGAGLLGGVGKLAGGLGSMGTIMNMAGGAGGGPQVQGTMSPSLLSGTGETYARGGMIHRYAKGGAAHDLLGTAGGLVGNFFFPIVGGMAGKFAGNALGDLIEGNTGNIGADAERDFTFGVADPDKPGGVGMPTSLPGLGGGSGGADFAGLGGADMADAGFAFQEGGPTPEAGNMVPTEASPSGGAETDDVHAMLNEGEFVVPKDVASWLGEKYLQSMIDKAHKEMAGPKAEPEMAPMPQAMAMAPPSFASPGARGQA